MGSNRRPQVAEICSHDHKILAGVQDGWIYYRCMDCKEVVKIPQEKGER